MKKDRSILTARIILGLAISTFGLAGCYEGAFWCILAFLMTCEPIYVFGTKGETK